MESAGDMLLRQLGSGVRPDGAAPARARPPIDQAAFAALLTQARTGALRSGRPVLVGPEAQLVRPLREQERTLLAQALDAAQAAGARRLLATLGDRPLLLDVETRSLVRELRSVEGEPAADDLALGLDAAVALRLPRSQDDSETIEGQEARGEETPRARGGLSPLAFIDNPSALEALTRAAPRAAAGDNTPQDADNSRANGDAARRSR